jgi:hypothetical protein
MAGSCEHNNESSDSVIDMEFLYLLSVLEASQGLPFTIAQNFLLLVDHQYTQL